MQAAKMFQGRTMHMTFVSSSALLHHRPRQRLSRHLFSCSLTPPSSSASPSPSSSPEVPALEPPAVVPSSSPVKQQQRSALDDLPASVKLNAVAVAVAKKGDHVATLRVLDEMNESSVTLEQSTVTSVVDASIEDHKHLASLLSIILPAGYGSTQITKNSDTLSPQTRIDPSRPLDLGLATGFVTIVSTALSAEIFEPVVLHHPADDANAVLILLGLCIMADRYTFSSSIWRRVTNGLTRLFSNDPARVAHIDAAAFLIAYLLGLPWLCYRPDGKRAAAQYSDLPYITSDSSTSSSTLHKQKYENKKIDEEEEEIKDIKRNTKSVQDTQIDKCLVWLVAPVAAELSVDNTLIQSDLAPARDFMSAIRAKKTPSSRQSFKEMESQILVAVSAAKQLLQDYRQTHVALAEALLSGASVGECIALISECFSSTNS